MQDRNPAGFSLIELTVVVAIGLIVAAIAVPDFETVIANTRLRASISSVSGVFQNARMAAVQKNGTRSVHFSAQTAGLFTYVKAAADTSAVASTDPQVELESPIVEMTSPAGIGAPSAVSSAALGFTPSTADTSFNARGIPCSYASGTCSGAGFLYYFKDTRRTGSNGWAAISISPAGRISRWFWNGSSWTN